ncbi:MAG TPA: A/G-specific adenine glycosylase [Polyangium sp.]|nr:A/G-specific adenine glycosylase [Polyangium sp.]
MKKKILPTNTSAKPDVLASALVRWFDKSARDLPWRRTRDPYAIWLSEVMLQQTRVETVIPYYERFLTRFPNVRDLAHADIDDVLALWSGLGYYRRARELHRCAKEVVNKHGGVFPAEVADLRALRGIGPYTAGAISSIAFDKSVPLVDGNVARVLARLFAIELDMKSTAGMREAWATAESIVPKDEPGKFNQALMELGATICIPRDPACLVCPVREPCRARATGRERELPIMSAKKASPKVPMVAVVVEQDGKVLFGRRKEGGLFGGLWEPPMVAADSVSQARGALSGAGIAPEIRLSEVGRVGHVLTHRELEVIVCRGHGVPLAIIEKPTTDPYEKLAWFSRNPTGIGISTLAKKILSTANKRPRTSGNTSSDA